MVGSRSSKRICRPNNGREVLSDFNEKLPECIELSDSRSSDSSCDSGSPIVKRLRKTKRKVLDPSKIHSSENVQVYSSLAKISFEKIHSAQFKLVNCCVETNDDCGEKEFGVNQNTGEADHPENTTSHEETNNQSSPSPPTPPPPNPSLRVRKLRSETELRRNLTRIESNIGNFDKTLNFSQPHPNGNDITTAATTTTTTTTATTTTTTMSSVSSRTRAGDGDCLLNDRVIVLDDNDDDDDDDLCYVCGEGSGYDYGGGGGDGSSILDESRTIVVMVKVDLEVKRFQLNYNDTFCKLFADLAHDLHVLEDHLILLLNDTTIHQNESPASMKLRASDILVCLVSNDTDSSQNMVDRTGPNIVHLVIQSNCLKKCNVNMSVGKFEPFQGVLDIYRKQQNLNSRPLKLYFDGELLDMTLTPDVYGIEDGDCLDLVQT